MGDKKKLSVTLGVVVVLLLNVGWFWDKTKAPEASPKPPNKQSSAASAQNAGHRDPAIARKIEERLEAFRARTSKTKQAADQVAAADAEPKKKAPVQQTESTPVVAPVVPQNPEIQKAEVLSSLPVVSKAPKVTTVPRNIYTARRITPSVAPIIPVDRSVVDVQKQINEMIKVNESLKLRYKAQAVEIQRISEQARIHQKILDELNVARKKKAELKSSDPAEEVLRQEKLKLIKEETEQNQKRLEAIGKKNGQSKEMRSPAKSNKAD